MTCDECRWKVERNRCPWDYLYKDDDCAEDCVDARNINWPDTAFQDYARYCSNCRWFQDDDCTFSIQ